MFRMAQCNITLNYSVIVVSLHCEMVKESNCSGKINKCHLLHLVLNTLVIGGKPGNAIMVKSFSI